MCEYCQQTVCPPACPSYEGYSAELGRRIGFCRKCGCSLYPSERFIRQRRQLLCGRCVDRAGS